MPKFKKKPVTVEAITFNELMDHGRRVAPESINGGMPWSFTYAGHHISHENDTCYLIPTLEGTMKMGPGDMLITGVQGEIYPCKRDIFEATYDAEPDAAGNESSHDFRHSSSYGGQLCADCGAVKGSRRGGLECRDPHAGVAPIALPVMDPGPDSLEREIQAKASTVPPHQQRVIDEKAARDGEIDRLAAFVVSNPVFATLPEDEQARLRRQLDVMRELSVILGERIAAF